MRLFYLTDETASWRDESQNDGASEIRIARPQTCMRLWGSPGITDYLGIPLVVSRTYHYLGNMCELATKQCGVV